ncbi:hypothetical protein H0H87_012168 [Tephrocybe sp. NHM501043]|nr:hypothetical protein H0H87_012168 [Tephrocybe sp. NHM501043]
MYCPTRLSADQRAASVTYSKSPQRIIVQNRFTARITPANPISTAVPARVGDAAFDGVSDGADVVKEEVVLGKMTVENVVGTADVVTGSVEVTTTGVIEVVGGGGTDVVGVTTGVGVGGTSGVVVVSAGGTFADVVL